MRRGGYGFTAFGRDQYGNINRDAYTGDSYDIEPRFGLSVPLDGYHGAPVTQALKFEVYAFRSCVDMLFVKVEISENGGVSYVTAYENGTVYSPYSVRYCRPDGQRIWLYVVKSVGTWPYGREIIIRFTGADEFGKQATKNAVVRWFI